MDVNIIIALIERFVAFFILFAVAIQAYKQMWVNDGIVWYRRGIFIAIVLYMVTSVFYLGLINFSSLFGCTQVWMSESGAEISGFGNLAIAVILYTFYFLL